MGTNPEHIGRLYGVAPAAWRTKELKLLVSPFNRWLARSTFRVRETPPSVELVFAYESREARLFTPTLVFGTANPRSTRQRGNRKPNRPPLPGNWLSGQLVFAHREDLSRLGFLSIGRNLRPSSAVFLVCVLQILTALKAGTLATLPRNNGYAPSHPRAFGVLAFINGLNGRYPPGLNLDRVPHDLEADNIQPSG
ncbi:hypothetical protein FIBSPDRAFT_901240 [Athelia psychrophila]|uniref:Uncharacterized protein n=1 Tax=Athelia psychrophila TaxID=1759441 RepID=A0A165XCT7_9AGAM|nr:hypothetical protein FIBSPDRAFT_901240 [Fibularhizoctonia sp. CBS 109695]